MAEFDARLSSSRNADPDTDVLRTAVVKTGEVKVLFVSVCVSVVPTIALDMPCVDVSAMWSASAAASSTDVGESSWKFPAVASYAIM